jgi:ferritin heavy chain
MLPQNRRGGRVKLQSILLPETEFNSKDKGDALYAMELALSLEKLNFTKLRELHRVAVNAEDAQLSDFIGVC